MVYLTKRFNSLSFKTKIRLYLTVLFLPICILLFVNYHSSKKAIIQNLKQESSRIITNIKHSCIESYLNDLEHCLSVMKQEVDTSRLNDPEYRMALIHNWAYYKKFNTNISYIYIGTESGDIFTYPEWTVPETYDPRKRPWYKTAILNPDKISWTEPYRDYTSGTMVLTATIPLIDTSGVVKGVLSIDTRYKNLSSVVSSVSIGPGAMLFMTDKHGHEIARSSNGPEMDSLINRNEAEIITSHASGVIFNSSENCFIAFSTISKTDWKLIGVIPDKTIQELLVPVKTNSITAIYAALVFFILIALIMQKRLDIEYEELNRHIAMITGNGHDLSKKRPLSRGIRKDFQPMLKQISTIKRQSITDSLTGLYNRGFIIEQLNVLSSADALCSVLLLDIDNFKAINDTFGHQKGDSVLVKLAQIINDNIRPEDMAGRFGGEEFIVIFNGLKKDHAVTIADRIMTAVRTASWDIDDMTITFSGGVTESDGASPDFLINTADTLMYKAKSLGKNRIVT